MLASKDTLHRTVEIIDYIVVEKEEKTPDIVYFIFIYKPKYI